MAGLLAVLITVGLFVAVLVHTEPLSPQQVESLAAKWRAQESALYFAFQHRVISVDPEFKRRMAAAGHLYSIQESLALFPSLAAALLKYKKHGWVLVGFERARSVVLLWMNKGLDNQSVEFQVSIEQMAQIALANNCSSVLILHNHPNPNPSKYSASRPSEIDLSGSQERALYLGAVGLNLFEFVCERGWPHGFRTAIADSFRAVALYRPCIEYLNDQSRPSNLRLHWARIFGSSDYRRLVTRMTNRQERRCENSPPQLKPQEERTVHAGWYPDPMGAHQHRYWDGARWSDFVADHGAVGTHSIENSMRSV